MSLIEEVEDLGELELELRRVMLLEAERRARAAEHPAFLLHFVKCVDSRSGDRFEFQVLSPEDAEAIGVESRAGVPPNIWDTNWAHQKQTVLDSEDRSWSWQRPYLDWCIENDQTVTLKGRQLGVTWIWAGLALWYLIYRPGSDVLVYSIKEDDAAEVINRIWDMWLSLPEYFKTGIRVLKPTKARPTTRIEVEHPDGRVSTITGMPATKSAGHSRSAALVIFDEASRQEHARDLWKAVIPASGDKGGKIGVISTANGMSDGNGLGNFFHEAWVGAGTVDYPSVKTCFLGWWLHPDRSQIWYDNVPLDAASKAEQYPDTPEEAFLMSGSPYFDVESLRRYADRVPTPLFQMKWEELPTDPSRAKLLKGEGLPVTVYRTPEAGRKYALAADTASGSGEDFSAAYVIDLHNMELVAEVYMKGDYESYATQLHFTGIWFNDAVLAVENQGGYGATVIAYLRDGLKGRKPYRKLYRQRAFDRPDSLVAGTFGYPMSQKTRPKVISELSKAIKNDELPWLTKGLLAECRTFVHRDTNPSPRAADGTNDDRVMSAGIALEMFAQFGEWEHDRRKKVRKQNQQPSTPLYPWSYK